MAFGFETPVPGKKQEKAGLPPEADQGRRDFLRKVGTAGVVTAGAALGADQIHRFMNVAMETKDRHDVAEKRGLELNESGTGYMNPLDELFSFEKGVREIGLQDFERMVDYWAWQYTDGGMTKDFKSGVAGLREHWHAVSRAFDAEGIPKKFALVSIHESFWNGKKWGKSGPFQVSPWAARNFHVRPETVEGSAKGAAKLFAEILNELDRYRETGESDKFTVLRYNGTYLRQYLKALEGRDKDASPSMAGFLSFMSRKAEEIRQRVDHDFPKNAMGRSAAKETFDSDIRDGAFGIRINIEYLAKYEATKRIFESDQSLVAMLRTDNDAAV